MQNDRTNRDLENGKRPVLYELVDKDGRHVADYEAPKTFSTAGEVAQYAMYRFPDQPQDPDRTCRGWDVQVCP